jgi:transcriptional regulator GlxA family with amidase domain
MNTIDPAAYEGDIVSRLRNWRKRHLAHCGELFEEAADEIARLKDAIRRLAARDATLSVQGGNVTVTMDATLTDGERAALHWFAHYGLPEHRAAALRGLLERLA